MVSDEHRSQFRDEGYFVLREALSAAELGDLRATCERYIAEFDSSEPVPEPDGPTDGSVEMQLRVTPEGRTFRAHVISRKGYRYFLGGRYFDDSGLRRFMRGPRMTEIATAVLGPEVYVHWDQFTVKGPESAGARDADAPAGLREGEVFENHFIEGYPKRSNSWAWHQDGAYIPAWNKPHLTVWIALDDMSEENGTLRVLPYAHAGGGAPVDHGVPSNAHHKTAALDADSGIAMLIPAGGAVVMSSNVFHCSRPNRSAALRRSLLAQYVAEPVTGEDGRQIHFADPLAIDGRRVGAG